MAKYSKLELIIIISIIALISSSKKEVKDLFPGLYDGEIYAGYLLTDIEGNELYYSFVPSQNDKTKDPVLLWLNGGPGCSSLFGWLTEIGPVVTELYSGKWTKNEYSWNKNVSLLFIESPAGVGFSKTVDPKQPWTEEKTAKGLLTALRQFFFEEFPEYKDKEFYISGESYAGIYIPNLVKAIIKDQEKEKINLKGALIGNGMTSTETDYERSGVEFAYWHAMIPTDLYLAFEANCPHLDPEIPIPNDFDPRNVTKKCNEIRRKIKPYYEGLDIYGIYRPCKPKNQKDKEDIRSSHSYRTFISNTVRKSQNKYNKYFYNTKNDEEEEEVEIFGSYCSDDFTMDELLNDPNVQKNLGVEVNKTWAQCDDVVYPETQSYDFYIDFLPNHPDIRVWAFSGDTDGIIPTLGTMRWIENTGYKTTEKFRQWKTNNQVSGFIQKFENNFTLVTVKGAGHMVPMDKRKEAFHMFMGFIFENNL